MTLALGTIVGPYRIESLLGRGGMGEVYLATHDNLGRKVALKLLAPELAADDGFRRRFIAESRLAASLDHPHIVPIYEAGEVEDRLFLAMRYVEGDDLGAILAREGPLEPTRAVGLLRGIADALDAAHDRGLVHRDVKPGNILVARTTRGDEHAYLGDFGLVKQLGSDAGFTRSGQLVGSVDYVAPEQIEGRPIDHRVDVYSLACVLYTALAGHPPYERESDVATLWAHVQTDPPRLSDLRPELSSLDSVIATGMAKDPAARYASAGALVEAARDGPPTSTVPLTPSRDAFPARWSGRRVVAGSAIAALALLGVAAFSALTGRLGETRGPSASATGQGIVSTSPALATIGAPTDEIAYSVLTPNGGGYLARTKRDGTSHVQLTEGIGFEPSWSPDGSAIAFVQYVRGPGEMGDDEEQIQEFGQEFTQVWLVDSDGTNSRQITTVSTGATQPTWSPDGKRLALVLSEYGVKDQQPVLTRSVIGVLDLITGSITVVGEDPAYRDSRPTWSPDGSRLAFQRELPSGPGQQVADIWAIQADGTDAVRVFAGAVGSWAGEPAWSPDAQLLAFTMHLPNSSHTDIYVVNLEGTALRRLTEHPGQDLLPSWSRDGASIAFQSDRDFRNEIYLMDSNGSRQTRLTHNPEGGGAFDPDWGPPTSAERP